MKKIICILLCISLILMPVLMTGCDKENDKKDETPTDTPSATDAPTDKPSDNTDAPTDTPTDTPTGDTTDKPSDNPTDKPVAEPIKDDPKSYVKFTAGIAELFLHISEITGDYREKILTGNEKFDSGKVNITANALSFAGNDYLSGNKYALDGIFAHGSSGTVVSGTFKGAGETGLQLFVTPDGTIYVMIPSVDSAMYVKLAELGKLRSSNSSSDKAPGTSAPSDNGTAEKLPESVKSITEEIVSVTVLGNRLDGVVKLTVTISAKSLESLADDLPEELRGLIANNIPENADATITLWIKDGSTVLADIAVDSTEGKLDLGLALVGESGKESYELTLKTEKGEDKTAINVTGKRENTDKVTKGSLSLKIESTKPQDGTDTDNSDTIAALLGNGTSIGLSYERKTEGNRTESLYTVSLGINAGFTEITVNIPLNAETVRNADGSVSHTVSIDTVKAKLPKELVNLQLSASFTLGEGLEGAGVTMPIFTAENTLDPNDPDDAEALAAYAEKFGNECKELAEFLKNLFGDKEEKILEGRFRSTGTPQMIYTFTANGEVDLEVYLEVDAGISTVLYKGSYKLVGNELTLTLTIAGKEVTNVYSFEETDTGIIINGDEYTRVEMACG